VLDIACGVGKGSHILATLGEAKKVTGCDIGEKAIRYARHRNYHNDIIFEVQDAEKYCKQNEYDSIVSFETIEHLKNYKAFLHNVNVSLKTNGIFIVSTPISAKSFDPKPENPYHAQEWGYDEFHNLLSEFFAIEKIYFQLYQNAFLNKMNFSSNTGTTKNEGFINKLVSKILNRLGRKEAVNTRILKYTEWNNKNNFSKIIENKMFNEISKLGSEYIGYQIVICKKK